MESWLSHTITNFRAQELKRGPMGEDYYDKSALEMHVWEMHNRADRGYVRKKHCQVGRRSFTMAEK